MIIKALHLCTFDYSGSMSNSAAHISIFLNDFRCIIISIIPVIIMVAMCLLKRLRHAPRNELTGMKIIND